MYLKKLNDFSSLDAHKNLEEKKAGNDLILIHIFYSFFFGPLWQIHGFIVSVDRQ